MTSLLGYGGTQECRTLADCSIDREAETLEAVVRKAQVPVHLVGHRGHSMLGGCNAEASSARKSCYHRMTAAALREPGLKSLSGHCGKKADMTGEETGKHPCQPPEGTRHPQCLDDGATSPAGNLHRHIDWTFATSQNRRGARGVVAPRPSIGHSFSLSLPFS